jgi:hypothetical protein
VGAGGRGVLWVIDDDVLNEDWIKNRMVRSHRLLSLVLVAMVIVITCI